MPRKSNLAIAQAAAMPKTALSGTAMAAMISVSRIADRASGLPSELERRGGALGQRLGEDRDERREEQDGEQRQHAAGQHPAQPVGLGGDGADAAAAPSGP